MFPPQKGCPLSLFSPIKGCKHLTNNLSGSDSPECTQQAMKQKHVARGQLVREIYLPFTLMGLTKKKKIPVANALCKSWSPGIFCLNLRGIWGTRSMPSIYSSTHFYKTKAVNTCISESSTQFSHLDWSEHMMEAAVHPQRMGLWCIHIPARPRPRGVFSQLHGASHWEEPYTWLNDLLSIPWNS